MGDVSGVRQTVAKDNNLSECGRLGEKRGRSCEQDCRKDKQGAYLVRRVIKILHT